VLAVARSATGGKCDDFLGHRARQVQWVVMRHASRCQRSTAKQRKAFGSPSRSITTLSAGGPGSDARRKT
jgi:hypothetical protein